LLLCKDAFIYCSIFFIIVCFRKQRNIIEAAFVGTSQVIPLVLNVGATLIAFLSLLAAVNGFLGWFGSLLDFPQLSFEVSTTRNYT